jgi:hypothetical protein
MSYCVNCGVELDRSEKACPLCGVEVINPRQPFEEAAERPYPKREDPANIRINRRFIAAMISIGLALPAALCLVIDFSSDHRLGWSFYVAGALVMIWVWLVPFFLYKRPSYFKVALPISASVLAYLWLIESLQAVPGWFWPLAMPLVLLVTVLVTVLAELTIHKILRGFRLTAAILVAAGLLNIGIELIIAIYLGRFTQHTANWPGALTWSWFVLIPCLALAAASLAVAHRQSVRAEILKRLHL